MFKTIGFKVSAAIFVVLLISFIVMQVILNLDFKNTANKMSRANFRYRKYFCFSNNENGYEFRRS